MTGVIGANCLAPILTTLWKRRYTHSETCCR
jgi:hypothetical protein